jgi:hypothetical protein
MAVTWLMMLAAVHCAQPDANHIHLPYGRKRQVWNFFMEDVARRDDLLPMPENKFCEAWHLRCPHIKVRVFHRLERQLYFMIFWGKYVEEKLLLYCRFALCTQCKTIEEELQRASTEQDRKMWLMAKQTHQNYVSVERHGYHFRLLKSHKGNITV